jgi:hypothetical protein
MRIGNRILFSAAFILLQSEIRIPQSCDPPATAGGSDFALNEHGGLMKKELEGRGDLDESDDEAKI